MTISALGVGMAPAAMAVAPGTPTSLRFDQATTHQPVLTAVVGTSGAGSLRAKFFARTAGSGTWNLVNGTQVPVTGGSRASLKLPAIATSQVVDWQVAGCDTAGACSTPSAITTDEVSHITGTGSRPGATSLGFSVGDRASAQIDVGSGNLQVTVPLLSLPGVGSDVPLSVTYNSLEAVQGQIGGTSEISRGWRLSPGHGVDLVVNADNSRTFIAAGGVAATFVPVSGSSTAYTTATGIKADLVGTSGGGYTLTDRESGQKLIFNAARELTEIRDRNGNATVLSRASGIPTGVESSRSNSAARNATMGAIGPKVASVTQTVGGTPRTAELLYASDGNLETVKDAAGRQVSLGYSTYSLTSISAPGGISAQFAFDSEGRVTSATQVNTTAGSSGNSTTRLAYPSRSQTLVAAPNTNQSSAITSVPRTTYTLTPQGRVSQAVDADGRTRSATYTANFDTASATRGTGTGASSVTNTFGANNGDSITASTTNAGSTGAAAYGNTGAGLSHLATSSTDDAGNQSLFTYDGIGNQLTSTDALAAQAIITRNTDGQVATAAAPGAGTNKSSYGYDTNHQLTSVTPPTGTSLGAEAFTWDGYGRLATATDGRGLTTSYAYDSLDRVTTISYSDTTPSVTYTYDTAGRIQTRGDASGTTTFGYDDLGRLTSRVNSFDGRTISFGYDKNGNQTSITDGRGTTTYTYTPANLLATMTYLQDGSPATARFAYDDQGRRTDTWMSSNATNTTWDGKSHTDYDSVGRVARVRDYRGTGDANNSTVNDTTYCYAVTTGTISSTTTCPTATSADRSLLQWERDNLTGSVTKYTYDGANRLTSAAKNGTGGETFTYTYDARGNRLTASTVLTAGGTPSTQTRTYNIAGQTTTSGYTYDAAGNQTADPSAGTLTYNAPGQLKSRTKSGTTFAYTYAGTGQNELLSHRDEDNTYYGYTYGRTNAQGLPIVEQVQRGSARGYIENDPTTGRPLLLRTNTGAVTMYTYDGRGNPTGLIAAGNYVAVAYTFDPYGVEEISTTSGGNAETLTPFTYAAGIRDRATGWVKYGTRWYNPTTGRWTQRDTLDAPLDPGNANRYAYAANDPINKQDPTGLLFKSIGVSGCFVAICAEAAFNFGEGKKSISGGIAAGPGIGANATAEVSSGSPGGGVYTKAGCAAGPVTGSVSADSGGPSASGGVSTPTKASCTLGVGYDKAF